MKNQIYTIPIKEAFDSECDCPVCLLESKLDKEGVEYTLGAAMMEPDFRIITNEKGFCKAHYAALIGQSKALPLALIMKSMYETKNKISTNSLPTDKKKLFGKSPKKQAALGYVTEINKFISSCAICDRTANTMDKFIKNIIFLWKTEGIFKQKLSKSTFCLPHFAKLIEYAAEGLCESDFEDFFKEMQTKQNEKNSELHEDISSFTELFDHRNSNTEPTPRVKSALKRCINNYSGFMQND